jgi:hypothetical protein
MMKLTEAQRKDIELAAATVEVLSIGTCGTTLRALLAAQPAEQQRVDEQLADAYEQAQQALDAWYDRQQPNPPMREARAVFVRELMNVLAANKGCAQLNDIAADLSIPVGFFDTDPGIRQKGTK